MLLADQCRFRVGIDIVDRRGLRQAGKKCGFTDRQILRRFPEIGLGGSFHPIGQISVIDLIDVQLKDFVFCVAPRNFCGEDDLARFTRVGLKLPYLGSVGALDMVNFWAPETVPPLR